MPVSAVAEATGNLGLRLRYNGSLTQHFCYDKDENGSAKGSEASQITNHSWRLMALAHKPIQDLDALPKTIGSAPF